MISKTEFSEEQKEKILTKPARENLDNSHTRLDKLEEYVKTLENRIKILEEK